MWAIDSNHLGSFVSPGYMDFPGETLYISTDGGKTWKPAWFGSWLPTTRDQDQQIENADIPVQVERALDLRKVRRAHEGLLICEQRRNDGNTADVQLLRGGDPKALKIVIGERPLT